MFKDLIDQLKPIKKPEDIEPELFDELINAAIAVGMRQLQDGMEEGNPLMAASELRSLINKHLDFVIIDIMEGEE